MEINQKLITKNLNCKGLFHLKELVPKINLNNTESIYIEFKPKLKKQLFKDILKTTKTVRNLSKQTNIKFTLLWDQLTRCPFSLSTLKRISKVLTNGGLSNYDLDKLEKRIFYIKSGGSKSEKLFYPWFPINFLTEEGMRFISHIYHDGSIGRINKQPHYINKSLKECKKFLRDSNKIFGKINRKIKKSRDGSYFIHLPTVIGCIMISIGYIPGDKTKNNPSTFKFLNRVQDKNLISQYLAKAFNDDGYIQKRGIGLQQTSLNKGNKTVPSNVLVLDKKFLERIGIKVHGPLLKNTYRNRYGICANFNIGIYSKENIRKFYNSIKLIDYKRKKLERYLNRGYKIKKE